MKNIEWQPTQKSLHTVVNDFKSGQIQIPIMQRGYVWDNVKRVALVDSLYRSFPLPPLYVWHDHASPEQGWVLDGQQRLSTLAGLVSDLEADDIVFAPDTEEFSLASKAKASATYSVRALWAKMRKLSTTRRAARPERD